MAKYYITKASRLGDTPYFGPTCDASGVEPAKWYDTREEAQKDADKMSAHNPVGFVVMVKKEPHAPYAQHSPDDCDDPTCNHF